MEKTIRETKKEMTKVIKYWMRFSFWNRVRFILAGVGLGTEVGMILLEMGNFWKGLVVVAAIATIILTYGVEDKNNNDIVDALEEE